MKASFYLLSASLLFCLFTINPLKVKANVPNAASGKYHAILIAIDNYAGESWSTLKNPVNDATAIQKLLSAKYGFENVQTLYNEEATRNNIIETIDGATAKLTENDNLLIFFSGHGLVIGEEGYWVPTEANTQERYELVSTTEIKNALTKTRSKHVLMMVDACFSSTIFKSSTFSIKNDRSESYYNQVEELLSRQAITAGGLEPVPDGLGEHSVFSKYIIKFLTKNKNNALDAGELFNMIKFPVAANTPNVPQFGHLQNTGHEGGQFVFRLKKEKTCNAKVYIKQGEIINFTQEGGILNAIANEKNVTYEWSHNSKILDHKEASLKITQPGQYAVTAISEDGTCTDAALADVTIKLPKISLEILEGSTVEFTYKGQLNANLLGYKDEVIYEWRKNGFLVEPNAKSITVTASDRYTLIAKLPDGRVLDKTTTKVIINERFYTTQLGDNIERVARKFYGKSSDAALIYAANPAVKNKSILKVGTRLVLPVKEEESKSIVSKFVVGANENFGPFSSPKSYKGGMLTEVVNSTLTEMNQPADVQFTIGKMVNTNIYYGESTIGYPVMKSKKNNMLFHYSEPLYNVLQVFFGINQNPINSIKSAIKKRTKKRKYKKLIVATTIGNISDNLDKYVTDKLIILRPFNSLEECFKALNEGKVDLVAAPQISGLNTIQNMNTLNVSDFNVLDKPIASITLHAAVSKKHPNAKTLITQFNTAFNTLKEQGLINKIIDNHIDILQKAP